MKEQNNFRFDEKTVKRLERLAKDKHTTKTNICENAIYKYYVGFMMMI